MPGEHTLNGRRVRGLTLWRPWPWTFTHADKRVENRSWKPPDTIVGGYLALHAGLKFDSHACLGMQNGEFGAAAVRIDPREGAHPHGVIVAVARLEGFHMSAGQGRLPGDDLWEFGPYVWRTPNVQRLSTPVDCKGAQGLWKLPQDVFEAVAAQIEGTD